ncbi:MAG: hypothetical protein ACI8YQ_002496 [Polaribacter sp.]
MAWVLKRIEAPEFLSPRKNNRKKSKKSLVIRFDFPIFAVPFYGGCLKPSKKQEKFIETRKERGREKKRKKIM